MVAAGVYCLNSKARWAIAEQLAEAQLSGDDIDRLRRWIASSEPREGLQRRFLAGLLSNPQDAAEALTTLERHAETRGSGDRNGMDYEPEPAEGEDPKQFRVERDAHIVFGRIHGDGADAATVAEELGIKKHQVEYLYTLGVQMFGGGL